MINKNFMKKYLYLSIAFFVVLFFVLLSKGSIYHNQLYSFTDWKWRQFHHPEMADSSVVLVAIDNKSLDFVENRLKITWPWPREFYALIYDYLSESQAASVTFDILMDDPERDRMEFAGGSSDGRLAASFSKNDIAILAAMIQESSLSHKQELHEHELIFDNSEQIPGIKYNDISLPLREFCDAGADIGIANFRMDSDGICRRLPLFFNLNNVHLPQLALSAYLKGTGDKIISYDSKKQLIKTQQRQFKLDKNGNFPIFWYGPGDANGVFRYDSFHALLMSAVKAQQGGTPDILPQEYKDKHIIICASASGLVDLKTTPFTSVAPYPGGEIHATLLSNLLNNHQLNTIPLAPLALLAFLLSALISYSFLHRNLRFSLLLTFSIIFLIISVNLFYFYVTFLDMDILLPLGSILFSGSISSIYRTINEGQAKRQMRSMFSRYLSNDVIDLLLKDPDKVDLEGSEIIATSLFTDLQNFTTYSEDKTPRDVIRALNKYFSVITKIVLDKGGLLDKYTGDGIMAIFGAPIPRKNHVESACEFILEFRNHDVNELIPTEQGAIATRIGISSGPMVVGNLGSSQRMDYTAIGDTVNLSARLEAVNKTYGTTNILSEFSWEFVKDNYFFRELDYIRVKGKNHPIRIFTLIDRHENIDEPILEREKLFNNAKELYKERKWRKAIKAFSDVIKLDPEDKASQAFIDRCELLKKHPDLVDEQGVFTFKTK